ncbi:MAG: hypothetical protein LBN28_05155 [Desulfovibrio sp.]|jgi:hypothetical protein|nr:hypothetical protein [Desulfovibrio sp.]
MGNDDSALGFSGITSLTSDLNDTKQNNSNSTIPSANITDVNWKHILCSLVVFYIPFFIVFIVAFINNKETTLYNKNTAQSEQYHADRNDKNTVLHNKSSANKKSHVNTIQKKKTPQKETPRNNITAAPTAVTTYEIPPVGSGKILSSQQIRWCVREKIRVEAIKPRVDSYSEKSVNYFNVLVENYNSRCSSFKYRSNNLNLARNDVEREKQKIVEEAVRDILKQ